MTTFGLELVLEDRRLKAGVNSAVQGFGQVERAAGNVNKAMGRVDDGFDRTRRKSSDLRSALAQLGVGFAAFRGLQSAVGTIADFEKVMAQVQGVTGATAEEMALLTKTARQLGATTQFTAAQAGQGILELSRAGFDAAQAGAAVGASLDLATAGLLDLDRASEITAITLKQFGLDASQAQRVTDVFVNTANRSATDVAQLAQAMKHVGPIAGELGFSLEETAAALGVLSDRGIQADMAGTALRGVLAKLAKPTSINNDTMAELQEKLAAVGLSLQDLAPQGRSLTELLGNLAKVGIDAEFAFRLFDTRAATGAATLGNATEALNELAKANRESTGTARKNAAILEQSLDGQFKALKSAVEELFLVMGDAGLLGAMKGVVQFATEVARALAGAGDEMGKISPEAKAVAGALEVVAVAGGALIGLHLANWIAGALTAFKALSLALLTNPFGIVVTTVGVLIGLLVKYRDAQVDIGGDTFRVGDLVIATWEAVSRRFVAVWKVAFHVVRQVVGLLGNVFRDVGNFILRVWNDIGNALGIDWGAAWKAIVAVTKAAVNVVIATVKSAFDVFDTIGSRIVGIVKSFEGFDLTSAESRQKVADAFGAALDIGGIGAEIARRTTANFQRDFVGEFIPVVQRAAANAQTIITDTFKDAGADVTLDELLNPATIAKEIRDRAKELERARQIEQYAGTEQDPRIVEDVKRLNEEREKSLATAERELAVQRDYAAKAVEAHRSTKELVEEVVQIRERELALERQLAVVVGDGRRAAQKAINEQLAGLKAVLDARRANLGELEEAAKAAESSYFATRFREIVSPEEEARRLRVSKEARAAATEAAAEVKKLSDEFRQAEEAAAGIDIDRRLTPELQAAAAQLAQVRENVEIANRQLAELDLTKASDHVARMAQVVRELTDAVAALQPAITAAELAATGRYVRPGEEPGPGEPIIAQRARQALAEGLDFGIDPATPQFARAQDVGPTPEQSAALGMHAEALRQVAEAERAGALAKEQYAIAAEKVRAKTEELHRVRALKEVFDVVGQSVTGALTDFIVGAKSAEDALKSFLQEMSRALVQKAVASLVGGLGGALFGGSFARGGVFDGGLTAFARGGVVDGPTVFPFANGVGLMGEAGPEAILPLERTSGGKLGVRASGGGETIVVNFNISTPDVDGFKKSQRQLADQARRTIGQARGNAGR